ncbi:PREDICTED: calmodulin-lysine N-methyltransferase isoform X2 [Tarenaya hassleriana]|uniref:calmodulin-lysine N-methyltransferase isoform X2 n=1 Tax=Tarenaya hassleriana TaxID=28532 RepID=UPI00053C4F7D|nr:PREDICTED: calmodulin-lysine N-methyltransferase isoform X2 [Tarenaya hassleriana]
MEAPPISSSSSLRWKILRQALLRKSDSETQDRIKRISRKSSQGFNLIPFRVVGSSPETENSRESCVCYTLPISGSPKLHLTQKADNCTDLSDFEISNRHNIDNTGLVCQWPSEEALAYFCLSQCDLFRGKRVIELGAGYGLAGLVIAAATEASEVVISDGNPQVVNYIERNIKSNSNTFGSTSVKAMELHWNQEDLSDLTGAFDIIVASDCTFFKEFHEHLARIVKMLLKAKEPSQALFFSPKRGDSLGKFLAEIEDTGLNFSLTENYDSEVWKRHQVLMNGDGSWPSYEQNHSYPLLVRITNPN